MITNESIIPAQLFAWGVTMMVLLIGLLPVFVAKNPGRLPEPLVPSPIAVFELVHVKLVPEMGPVNTTPEIVMPLQTVISDGTITVGEGFTVILYVEAMPVQLFALGVTVIRAVMAVAPVFVATKPGISPLPAELRPIAVFEFVQEYAAPATGLVKDVPETVFPLQIIISEGTVTEGVGFTVIV